MRLLAVGAALMLAGCAAGPTSPEAGARRHADNLAAAREAGYRVVVKSGQTMYCTTQAPTGSHVAPGCLTERQWEQQQLTVWRLPFCPAAAESCSEPGHSLVIVVDPQ